VRIELLRALNADATQLLRTDAPSEAQVRAWVLICLLRMELRE